MCCDHILACSERELLLISNVCSRHRSHEWYYLCYIFDTFDSVQTCHCTDVNCLVTCSNSHQSKLMTTAQSPSFIVASLELKSRHPDPQSYTLSIPPHSSFLFKTFLLHLLLFFLVRMHCWFYNVNQPKKKKIQPNFPIKQRTSVGTNLQMKKLNIISHSKYLPLWKWDVGADKGQKSSLVCDRRYWFGRAKSMSVLYTAVGRVGVQQIVLFSSNK